MHSCLHRTACTQLLVCEGAGSCTHVQSVHPPAWPADDGTGRAADVHGAAHGAGAAGHAHAHAGKPGSKGAVFPCDPWWYTGRQLVDNGFKRRQAASWARLSSRLQHAVG